MTKFVYAIATLAMMTSLAVANPQSGSADQTGQTQASAEGQTDPSQQGHQEEGTSQPTSK